uniref:Uncharacterized protein n=1 Tax=Mola mola TaxID=94237 RepID=A0A3Q3WCB0_MOLML
MKHLNSLFVSICVFQNLLSQMKDFEACAEPLQECLNATELAVQKSSTRLHDLTAKKMELYKLQVVKPTAPRAPIMLKITLVQVWPSLNAWVPT